MGRKQGLQDRLNQGKGEGIEYRIEQRIEKIRDSIFSDRSGKTKESPIGMHCRVVMVMRTKIVFLFLFRPLPSLPFHDILSL